MIFKNYLPNKINTAFSIVIVCTFLFGFWMLFLLALPIYAGVWYLFRKKSVRLYQDDFINTQNVLSPVSGKAQQVFEEIDHPFFGNGLNAIRFRVNFLDGYGVYLPISTEVKNIQTEKIKEINRFKDYDIRSEDFQSNGTLIKLNSKMDELVGLQILKGRLSLTPKVVIQPGDRGRARANIGVMPFGGSIVLYFNNNYKTHIKEGDDVDAGKTIIASSREGHE